MILKLFLIIKILLNIQIAQILGQFPQEKPINCLIHNQKYSYEYLYATDKIFSSMPKNQNIFYNVYINPIGLVNDYNRLKWTISQVGHKSNATVTIKSTNNEYLCSSNSYKDISRYRRKLYLHRISSKQSLDTQEIIGQNCQWRLERLEGQTYIIWNDWFNEPLYAPTFFYKYDLINRNVYLWKNKPSSSGEFKWLIDCIKGRFLLE
jgi:hypothetical protein